jgi:hypothetical protein
VSGYRGERPRRQFPIPIQDQYFNVRMNNCLRSETENVRLERCGFLG